MNLFFQTPTPDPKTLAEFAFTTPEGILIISLVIVVVIVAVIYMYLSRSTICPICKGKGTYELSGANCTWCGGTGRID